TTIVDLNFAVPVGGGLQLGCVENNLFRNNAGVAYPYAIGSVGEITGSTFGNSYYYYFYDWKIQQESIECVSERVEVNAAVVGINELSANPFGLNIFPNPAADQLNITLNANVQNATVRVTDALGRVVIEQKMNFAARAQQRLNIEALESGVYHITLTQDGLKSSIEFVKQ
ncbi:MAG: T9SS type A sorting domain-containing protein, partial [Flavobacteriales bacterium]